MSLSTQARRHIEVAVADEKVGKEVADAIDDAANKQGVAVANAAGATPTKAEFDALLTSLRNAGVIAAS